MRISHFFIISWEKQLISLNIFYSAGKCGSWSFNHNTNLCYLHDIDGCCDQFNKRKKDDNFISGYICSVCWSTKNDCPCNKEEREKNYNLGFNYCSGCKDTSNQSSTVSKILITYRKSSINVIFVSSWKIALSPWFVNSP